MSFGTISYMVTPRIILLCSYFIKERFSGELGSGTTEIALPFGILISFDVIYEVVLKSSSINNAMRLNLVTGHTKLARPNTKLTYLQHFSFHCALKNDNKRANHNKEPLQIYQTPHLHKWQVTQMNVSYRLTLN
jgi:hypothetical protein